MKQGAQKLSLAQAVDNAIAFQRLFSAGAEGSLYELWMICGSVRRKRPFIGDIDHVVIPRFAEAPVAGSMFSESEMTNLLWRRCDELLAAGTIDVGPPKCWGEKIRRIIFNCIRHEIAVANENNVGVLVAVKTGPAEFSKMMVTALHQRGLRSTDGFQVKYKRDGSVYPCRTEKAFFEAAGVKYMEPWERR